MQNVTIPALPTLLPGMVCSTAQFSVETEYGPQFIDITNQVAAIVERAKSLFHKSGGVEN